LAPDFDPAVLGSESLLSSLVLVVLLIEDAHDLLQLLLGEPRIDRRRLNIGVPEVFLAGS